MLTQRATRRMVQMDYFSKIVPAAAKLLGTFRDEDRGIYLPYLRLFPDPAARK
jgi:hypothetical protein